MSQWPKGCLDVYKRQLYESAKRYGKSPYGKHLKNVADDKYLQPDEVQ